MILTFSSSKIRVRAQLSKLQKSEGEEIIGVQKVKNHDDQLKHYLCSMQALEDNFKADAEMSLSPRSDARFEIMLLFKISQIFLFILVKSIINLI